MEMRRGTMVPTDELCSRILRYRSVFKRSGGGITISGGEPLMQPAGVARLLSFAKEHDIHTAIDTSGFLGWRATDEMLENLDLCLLDIKSGSEDVYRRVTGQQLQPTLDFAQRLSDADVPIWVRFVLVPGHTDSEENIEQVARIAASLPTLERVEVLPFHQMGRDKWESLGLDYRLGEVEPPSADDTARARRIFADYGLVVH